MEDAAKYSAGPLNRHVWEKFALYFAKAAAELHVGL